MKRFFLPLVALIFLPVSAEAAARFWVGGTGTWDNSDTTHWSGSSGGAGGSSVPASGDTVTFDGSSGGGTVTVAATINGSNTITSITMGAFTGTLDFSVNNPSITMGTFSITGTGTRTLSMGSGTFTLTSANANVWDATTTTNLTFNKGTSTIKSNYTGTLSGKATLVLGTLSYSTVSIAAAASAGTLVGFSGSATVDNLLIAAPNVVEFGNNQTLTVNNAFTFTGTSSAGLILQSNSSFVVATVAVGAASTIQWASIARMTFTTNSVTATNSMNLGSVTGATITGPSTSGGGIIGG